MPRRLRRTVAVLWSFAIAAGGASAETLLPSFEEVRAGLQPSNVVLLDRSGAPIAEGFPPAPRLRLEWTPLRSLPPELLHVLLVAEDQRFFEHSGVDWRAFVAALWQNLWYQRKRGASTLSMQLVGLLDPELRPSAAHGGRRTIGQKLDQTLAARELEARWSKEQILEAYLNLVRFRGRLEGIGAAAWGLFGKSPAQLERPEAALLSALLRAPNARAVLVEQRACRLLRRLDAGADCRRLPGFTLGLDTAAPKPRWDLAPDLLALVSGRDGRRIATTLDPAWQAAARDSLAALPGRERAALVVIDPEARIAAYAASSDPAAAALREPLGEQDAALLLALGHALGDGEVGPASLVLLGDPRGDEETGWASVRRLLEDQTRESRHWLAAALPDGRREWRRLIGAAPFDAPLLAALVRMIGNQGAWQLPYWTVGTPRPEGHRLLAAEGAFLLAGLLPPAEAGGCLRRLALLRGQGSAFAALLGHHAVVVLADRAGTASRVLAALAAAPMGRAACKDPLAVPPGVARQPVRFEPPVEPPRSEWFLSGHELEVSRAPLAFARIAWPRERSIVDGRPAIEDPAFRVHFLARPALAGLRWVLDGVAIGDGPQAAWMPRAGLHRLELVDRDGRPVDSLEFAARGPL